MGKDANGANSSYAVSTENENAVVPIEARFWGPHIKNYDEMGLVYSSQGDQTRIALYVMDFDGHKRTLATFGE